MSAKFGIEPFLRPSGLQMKQISKI